MILLEIFFGLILLLVVVAIVVLFAMFGELASRVPESDRTGTVIYDSAQIGTRPDQWPEPLRHCQDGTAQLVVLSPTCTTCRSVAEQIMREPTPATELALVISCSTRESGEAFIQEHDLGALVHYIDVGGQWVTHGFGISVSPCALLLRDGMLVTALLFQEFATLQDAIPVHLSSEEISWASSGNQAPEPKDMRDAASSQV